jgi:hypothetical protein
MKLCWHSSSCTPSGMNIISDNNILEPFSMFRSRIRRFHRRHWCVVPHWSDWPSKGMRMKLGLDSKRIKIPNTTTLYSIRCPSLWCSLPSLGFSLWKLGSLFQLEFQIQNSIGLLSINYQVIMIFLKKIEFFKSFFFNLISFHLFLYNLALNLLHKCFEDLCFLLTKSKFFLIVHSLSSSLFSNSNSNHKIITFLKRKCSLGGWLFFSEEMENVGN